jgi:hypothetical protein
LYVFHVFEVAAVSTCFLLYFGTVLIVWFFCISFHFIQYLTGASGTGGKPGAAGARGRPGAQGPQGPRGAKGKVLSS